RGAVATRPSRPDPRRHQSRHRRHRRRPSASRPAPQGRPAALRACLKLPYTDKGLAIGVDFMRFALLGNENDGVALARALAAAGHRLLYVAAAPRRQPWPDDVKRVADVEEVLADPNLEVVLVASPLDRRAALVRRALQSERAVLCLHPIETKVDAAYEAGMLQQDTRQLLLPLMPEAFHPAILRLKSLLAAPALKRQDHDPARNGLLPSGPLAELRLLEIEHHAAGEALLATEALLGPPCVPHWNVLRALGGEIAEVAALSPGDILQPGTPVLLSGRFEGTALFQTTLVPRQAQSHLRLRVVATEGTAELLFPL